MKTGKTYSTKIRLAFIPGPVLQTVATYKEGVTTMYHEFYCVKCKQGPLQCDRVLAKQVQYVSIRGRTKVHRSYRVGPHCFECVRRDCQDLEATQTKLREWF